MKDIIKVLMLDDHPLILEGYKNIILEMDNEGRQIVFEISDSIESAFNKIGTSVNSSNFFDIIFLDINLPEYPEEKIYSGEDLALFIRKVSPHSKIIFLTMHNENFRLYNIVKNINPEGLLIKSDVASKDLMDAFNDVLAGRISYSDTVLKFMRNEITNEFTLDQYDREIIFQLSKGVQTKKLPEVIPLSLAAIEKRKRQLKDIFGIEKEGDLVLINKARQLGVFVE
ncbi:response regulator [Salegentibacter sp. LM13S]|uniref:response regulator n=1 Tax=Salegentibacter lacus TaxID=2873599 RepID=UPI001CCBE80B|nr:response regulator [Salegentibacter lacus]MBZ9632457.1 response regulator [Salegentibacter lacus]